MGLVKVFYQHREGGHELVDHEKALKSHREACNIIDNYPWAEELKLFEALEEGGGFFFLLGDLDSQYASFQLTPIEEGVGMLNLEVVYKPGFLGFFGGKSASADFKSVSIPEAKHRIKELFEHSIESLYKKYKA